MVIKDGHAAPLLSLQLYVGTIPHPLGSVNCMTPTVVNIELAGYIV